VLWETVSPFLQALLVARLVDTLVTHADAASAWPELLGRVVAMGLVLLARYVLSHFAEAFLQGLSRDVDRVVGMRMLRAVARPTGIAHLEDAEVADQIALARGAIVGSSAGRAIRIVGRFAGGRLSALVIGVALFQFRWWAPLLLAAGMAVTRLWAQRDMMAFMNGFEMATPILRRAAYFRDLLLSPEAAKEVRIFGMADVALERFRSGWQQGLSEVVRRTARNRWVLAAAVVMQGLAFGWVAVSVALAGARGEVSPGQVAFYLQAAVVMLGASMNVDVEYELAKAAMSFSRVAKLDRRLQAENHASAAAPADLPSREIRLERVSFAYANQDRPVFHDLDMVVPAGRSLAIVGPNGAGKTTLVKLLARLYQPDSGRILVDGVDASQLDPVSWRQRVAVLFQDFCRWELPVRDNVGFGALGLLSDAKLWEVLERTGAESFVSELPNELDTPLSRRFRGGTDLSGGQWQRIALARALAAVERGARILILDEPTASLDVRAEAEFYERFLNLTQGLTTIVISHRFSTVRLADQIVVVEDGRVVEQGSHDDLMRLDGSYARMFRLQAERFNNSDTEALAQEAAQHA
jgi:ATP-binding cassette, subfamily B, bacterial